MAEADIQMEHQYGIKNITLVFTQIHAAKIVLLCFIFDRNVRRNAMEKFYNINNNIIKGLGMEEAWTG